MFNYFKKLKKNILQRLKPKSRKGALALPWYWYLGIASPIAPVIGEIVTGGKGIKKLGEMMIAPVLDSFLLIYEGLAKFFLLIATGVFKLITYVFINFAQYNNFIHEPAVVEAWTILRDVANMFFIFLFLIMAVGTILKNEKYSWQKMLVPLALMAIFINFSRTICGLVIDFAQVIMMTFVNAFKGVASGNFIKLFGLDHFITAEVLTKQYQAASDASTKSISNGMSNLDGIAMLTVALFLAFVALVILIAITIIIVIRIITLWFLVVLSPIAFIAYIVPGLQKYAKQWQDKFFTQVIVGPVLAFFLWVSFLVIERGTAASNTAEVKDAQAAIDSANGNIISFPVLDHFQYYMGYLIGAGLLIGTAWFAKNIGAFGAGVLGNASSMIQKGGKAIAGGIGKGLGYFPKQYGKKLGYEVGDRAALLAGRLPLVGNTFLKYRTQLKAKRDMEDKKETSWMAAAEERDVDTIISRAQRFPQLARTEAGRRMLKRAIEWKMQNGQDLDPNVIGYNITDMIASYKQLIGHRITGENNDVARDADGLQLLEKFMFHNYNQVDGNAFYNANTGEEEAGGDVEDVTRRTITATANGGSDVEHYYANGVREVVHRDGEGTIIGSEHYNAGGERIYRGRLRRSENGEWFRDDSSGVEFNNNLATRMAGESERDFRARLWQANIANGFRAQTEESYRAYSRCSNSQRAQRGHRQNIDDVNVPRLQGETDNQYRRRLIDVQHRTTKNNIAGWILKDVTSFATRLTSMAEDPDVRRRAEDELANPGAGQPVVVAAGPNGTYTDAQIIQHMIENRGAYGLPNPEHMIKTPMQMVSEATPQSADFILRTILHLLRNPHTVVNEGQMTEETLEGYISNAVMNRTGIDPNTFAAIWTQARQSIVLGRGGAQITDIRKYNATKELYEKHGEKYEESEEYKKDSKKYFTQEEFKQKHQEISQDDGASAPAGNKNNLTGINRTIDRAEEASASGLALQSARIGADLSQLGIKGKARIFTGNEKLPIIEKIAEMMKAQGKSEEEVGQFIKAANQAQHLEVFDRGMTRSEAKHQLAHERMHIRVDSLSKEAKDRAWDALDEKTKEQIRKEVKEAWQNQNMSEDEIKDEYFAEGLTNETQWGVDGGIELDKRVKESLQSQGVKIEDLTTGLTGKPFMAAADSTKEKANLMNEVIKCGDSKKEVSLDGEALNALNGMAAQLEKLGGGLEKMSALKDTIKSLGGLKTTMAEVGQRVDNQRLARAIYDNSWQLYRASGEIRRLKYKYGQRQAA